MYKLIDENGQEHFYHSVNKISSLVDLKRNFQYVFVQEKGQIVIWQVVNDNGAALWSMKEVTDDLTDYYKRVHDRNFDTMFKMLLCL
jgi:uncharacterized protein YrzB (UPF0473 family)